MKNLVTKVRNGSVVAATAVSTNVLAFGGSVQAQDCDLDGGISAGVDCSQPTGANGNLFDEGGIFQTIADVLLFLVGAISVIMLIVGGIRYVVSAGDQTAVTNAKNTILYAIVGIVVAFLAFAAVRFVVGRLEA